MAEIARNYMEIRSNQKMAILIEENIALLEKNAEIVLKNFEEGYANKLDYENIQAQLATAKSQLPDLVANVYKSIYSISILTGEPPETLLPELLPIKSLPKVPNLVAVGVKSDLLRRRPDVRYAERQLAYAVANLGVSVANFYPSISLFGIAGLDALKFSNLFKWKARDWAYGGDINQPVFQGGKLMGNLKAARATRDQYFEKYEQAVLNALSETESYYMSYAQDLKKSKDLKEAANRNHILVKLTADRYNKGLVNLISLLNSEGQLISSEESLLQSETTALLDLISLYKSLGGGWQIKE